MSLPSASVVSAESFSSAHPGSVPNAFKVVPGPGHPDSGGGNGNGGKDGKGQGNRGWGGGHRGDGSGGNGGERDPFGRPKGNGGPENGNGGSQPALNMPKTIIALIAIMAVVQFLRGALPADMDAELMFRGSLLLVYQGQFLWDRLYTLITSAFLHDGWLHFGFNAFWLATIGTLVHRVLGGPKFLLLFFISVIAGGLAQTFVAWNAPVFLVGASGGVFGMIGAMGHIAVVKPWDSPPQRLRKLLMFTAIMMAINVAYAYIGGGLPSGEPVDISWAAHGGGLIAGVLIFPLLWKLPYLPNLQRPDR
ncbi:rhomboid family intramembrane serine protease [Rhodovibrionaceae bacterium A322]